MRDLTTASSSNEISALLAIAKIRESLGNKIFSDWRAFI